MELSTIIPSPKASPPSVKTFNVSPVKYMSENVEIIAIGIDNAITIVARTLFKKSSKIKTEITPPISKFCVTEETDSSIKSDVSITVVSSAPSGNCSFNSSYLRQSHVRRQLYLHLR